jgi:hypothetical protein
MFTFFKNHCNIGWMFEGWRLLTNFLKFQLVTLCRNPTVGKVGGWLMFKGWRLLTNFLKFRLVTLCHNPNVGKVGGWLSHSQNGDLCVATPLWPSVGVKPNTPKVGDLKSSRTPECLEFNNKAQNSLHWSVFGVIGKVLKRKYRKWPRIGHLDICNPSYGQKKGRESNW